MRNLFFRFENGMVYLGFQEIVFVKLGNNKDSEYLLSFKCCVKSF